MKRILTAALLLSTIAMSAQTKYTVQTACHPDDVRHYDTETLRARFMMPEVMVADEINALLAQIGVNWWNYRKSWPELEMYDKDGAHASAAGSDFAAKYIWETIFTDLRRKG